MPVLSEVDVLRLGTQAVDAVYLGEDEVWRAWSPAAVAGLLGWWDASQLTLIDGEPVMSWPDASGHERTLLSQPAVQDGTAPRFAAAGLNGHGVVRYDGTNVLITTDNIDYRHFFVVAKYASAQFLDYDGLLTGVNTALLIGDAGSSHWYAVSGPSVYHKNGVLDPGLSGPMAQWAVMSLSNGSGWNMGPFRLGLDRIYGLNSGYNRYWVGDVAEVIGYGQQLSDTDRTQIEAYLRAKWGL